MEDEWLTCQRQISKAYKTLTSKLVISSKDSKISVEKTKRLERLLPNEGLYIVRKAFDSGY